MKYLYKIILLAFLLILFYTNIFAQDSLGFKSDLAEALNFPEDKLVMKNLLEGKKRGADYDKRLKAYLSFKSNDNSFAPIILIISDKGTIFTPKLRKKVKNEKEDEDFKKIIRDKKLIGFYGIAGMGPGATQKHITFTIPEASLDLRMVITFSSVTPINRTEENKDYYDKFVSLSNNKKYQLLDELMPVAEKLSRKLIAKKNSNKGRRLKKGHIKNERKKN